MSSHPVMSAQELEARQEKARAAFCREDGAPASEVARLWGSIDVWALLSLARQDENVLLRLSTHMLWGCCPAEPDEDFFVAERQLHDRVLGYVEASPRSLEWFASLMSSIDPKPAFEVFSQQRVNIDFDAFHAGLARLLRAAGLASGAPDSIGGLARDVYWPTAVLRGSSPTTPSCRTGTTSTCMSGVRNYGKPSAGSR